MKIINMGIAINKLQYSGYTPYELFDLLNNVARKVGTTEHMDIVDVPRVLTDLASKNYLPQYLAYTKSVLEVILPHWRHIKNHDYS